MKYFNQLLALIILTALSLLVHTECMAESNAFSVKNYEVSYKHGNPNTMREKAIKKATKGAFTKLLRQLTPHHTWSVHSRLMKHVNWDDISYKSRIVSESYTPTYKVILDVFYRAEAVKKLLTKFNIPYSESTGGKVLIIPVYEESGSKLLWETVNPLKRIISENMRSHSYFDFTLPTGDIAEVTALNAEMATLGAGDIILSIAENYEANAAVVFHTKVSERFNSYYLDVTATWYEDGELIEPSIFSAPIENNLSMGGDLDPAAIDKTLKTAVNETLSRLGAHKRNKGLVEVNRPARVFLRFKPADARDLEKLKELVSSLNVIREFKLRVLNVKDSVFQVDFYGDKQSFKSQLEKLTLTVQETSMPMVWKVQFENDPFLGPVDYGLEPEG